MPAADDRLLRHSAQQLAELAAGHGITTVHLDEDPAELVGTLEAAPALGAPKAKRKEDLAGIEALRHLALIGD